MAFPYPVDREEYDPETVRRYGYVFIAVLWLGGLIALNTLLGLWKLVVPQSSPFYQWWVWFDWMVLGLFGSYVVVWWWSVISWCGNELFKHLQGLKGKRD
ncbi:hypothetical protein JNB11_03015 [Kocuria palustris]|nr:hypothetical protein [Kocuria palustris]